MTRNCFLVLCLVLCPSAALAEKIDCESMAEVGAGLDLIREGLEAGEEVDDETDQAMADVVSSLYAIAREEGNAKLDRAVKSLETAWQRNDRPGYVRALEEIDTLFGALYTADCD